MCFGGGAPAPVVIQQPAPVQAPPPPPPPANQTPKPPELAPSVGSPARDAANSKRKGSQVFRNDLSIPSGAPSGGSGLNIPT